MFIMPSVPWLICIIRKYFRYNFENEYKKQMIKALYLSEERPTNTWNS